jgi:hypothetical protein
MLIIEWGIFVYIVSKMTSPVSAGKLEKLEREQGLKLPEAYVRFLVRYGPGTYRGWFNIDQPDLGVLKPFAEYEFWEHDEASPITQAQIAECVSIGTTIDGDFLAVHPDVEGIVWMPRHSETIKLYVCGGMDYTDTLNRIFAEKHSEASALPDFFEPWNPSRKHRFFRFSPYDAGFELPELARRCGERFAADLLLENVYSCKLFLLDLGGYIRFNYANRLEVAVFYEGGKELLYREIAGLLENNHCTALPNL